MSGLEEKDNGDCPVAVGSTFRRLAIKVGAKPLSAEIREFLHPVQLGISTRGGLQKSCSCCPQVLEWDDTEKKYHSKLIWLMVSTASHAILFLLRLRGDH